MSGLTTRLFAGLGASNKPYVQENSVADGHFDATNGEATLSATDGINLFTAKAKGDPDGHTGTTGISMEWREDKGNGNSYARRMAKWSDEVRQTLVLRYSGVARQTK